MSRILLQTHISSPRQRVFDLARDVGLHERSTRNTGEKAVAGVTSGLMDLGSTVTWRAKHLGVWQKLTVTITKFEAPTVFVDEMVRGAFKSMRHVHRFEATEGGTLMLDDFQFKAPFGILGVLVERLFLTGYMRRFLLRRNAVLKKEAERSDEQS